MAENKRYYFLKLKEDFFKDETILLLGLVEELTDGSLFMSNIQAMIGTTHLKPSENAKNAPS